MKKLLIAAAIALTTLFSVPSFADPFGGPTRYEDSVYSDSNEIYFEDFVGGSTTVIELFGS